MTADPPVQNPEIIPLWHDHNDEDAKTNPQRLHQYSYVYGLESQTHGSISSFNQHVQMIPPQPTYSTQPHNNYLRTSFPTAYHAHNNPDAMRNQQILHQCRFVHGRLPPQPKTHLPIWSLLCELSRPNQHHKMEIKENHVMTMDQTIDSRQKKAINPNRNVTKLRNNKQEQHQCASINAKSDLINSHKNQRRPVVTSSDYDIIGTEEAEIIGKEPQNLAWFQKCSKNNVGPKQFRCPLCRKSIKTKKAIPKHYLNVHAINKPHKCHYCSKGFGQNQILKRHIKLIHEAPLKFQCQFCLQRFRLKRDYNRHIKELCFNNDF